MHWKNQIAVILLIVLITGCKSKKKQLLDTEEVVAADFIDFFPDIKLPFHLADTSLIKKSPDSLRIGNKVFAQFVPDSILQPVFGKKTAPQIYPIGKSMIKDGETYLLIKAALGTKRAGYALVFEKEAFKAALPLVVTSSNPPKNEQTVANLDSRYTFTTLRQRTAADGQILYHKDVYVYNTAGVFTLILTESNDQANKTQKLLNPIDTLTLIHKLTGDYLGATRNIVSFRDSHRKGGLLFFVHFEKDNGTCIGELKGEAKITGANSARYTENNGPCVIDFNFSGNTVTMKEVEGCGSYRDIKCFFEGRFTRKKKSSTTGARKKK
ncbi:hypothetical protein [Flavihumibacter sp. CACIAM 22H1]|uniref:hypothetical protein n=1 Tax=Flavihumibacter sp. CACIAM 22H1 TaxID=1812911 RepID=UPI0007A85CFB|nr:hypothetical protein [Flavihumibacter sp. CACIAM 22H1]KYP13130.1 MAG: hypothetical protein A1D16_01365 [Flavihumibacter sp. CACIAM 22H1]